MSSRPTGSSSAGRCSRCPSPTSTRRRRRCGTSASRRRRRSAAGRRSRITAAAATTATANAAASTRLHRLKRCAPLPGTCGRPNLRAVGLTRLQADGVDAACRRRSAPGRPPAGPSRPRPPRSRARAAASSRSRVLSAIASTFAGRASRLIRSCSVDELGERRDREALVVVDDRCPALWQSTSACGARRGCSPSVTPEYAGWSSEPWPSTKSSSPPRSTAFEHELLGGAGDEVGDDGVDGDPPPRDRDPGLAGRHELARRSRAGAPRGRARARRSSSRSRSRSRP